MHLVGVYVLHGVPGVLPPLGLARVRKRVDRNGRHSAAAGVAAKAVHNHGGPAVKHLQ